MAARVFFQPSAFFTWLRWPGLKSAAKVFELGRKSGKSNPLPKMARSLVNKSSAFRKFDFSWRLGISHCPSTRIPPQSGRVPSPPHQHPSRQRCLTRIAQPRGALNPSQEKGSVGPLRCASHEALLQDGQNLDFFPVLIKSKYLSWAKKNQHSRKKKKPACNFLAKKPQNILTGNIYLLIFLINPSMCCGSWR